MGSFYIVCGPESSGNRLLASVLCRSGCLGEGSTEQPVTFDQLPKYSGKPFVAIKHYDIGAWHDAAAERGFTKTYALLIVREPIANCESMVKIGHRKTFDEAYYSRNEIFQNNIKDAASRNMSLHVVTYEGLNEGMLKKWLPMIGLNYVSGFLNLPGQLRPKTIVNQNRKHYE